MTTEGAKMTNKREPFAVISYCIEADENALSVGNQTVAGDGKHGFDHVALVDICKRINAAFNARVDDEVKKALEEFRERAAKHIRSECIACGGSGKMPGKEWECEYCGRPRDALYALPTEAEENLNDRHPNE